MHTTRPEQSFGTPSGYDCRVLVTGRKPRSGPNGCFLYSRPAGTPALRAFQAHRLVRPSALTVHIAVESCMRKLVLA